MHLGFGCTGLWFPDLLIVAGPVSWAESLSGVESASTCAFDPRFAHTRPGNPDVMRRLLAQSVLRPGRCDPIAPSGRVAPAFVRSTLENETPSEGFNPQRARLRCLGFQAIAGTILHKMRLAAKTDKNQAEIVEGLRKAGCEVLSLARVGHGCPDLAVTRAGTIWFLECKTDGGTLNAAQIAFAKRWPVHVVRSLEAALAVVGLRKVAT